MKRASSTTSISLALIAWLICGCFGIALAGGADTKHDCQATPQCAELLNRGIKDYQQKLYPSARRHFEQALTLSTDPRLLVLMGRTHFKMNDARGALSYYEQAQGQTMGTADRTKLEQYIAEARTALPANIDTPQTPPSNGADLSQAATPTPAKEDKKLKPWIWAVIGVAAVAVVGTAIGVGVYYGTGNPTPDFTVRFP